MDPVISKRPSLTIVCLTVLRPVYFLFKAHSTPQTCPCATVSKLLDGYEEAERGYDPVLSSKLVTSQVLMAFILTPSVFQVTALSADCQESTKQLCLNSGMDAFLSKPANKTQLFSMLQRLVPPTPLDQTAHLQFNVLSQWT